MNLLQKVRLGKIIEIKSLQFNLTIIVANSENEIPFSDINRNKTNYLKIIFIQHFKNYKSEEALFYYCQNPEMLVYSIN